MKKLFLICIILSLCLLSACGGRSLVVVDGDYVVITVEEARVGDGTTLKQYMDMLVADGTLTYEMDNGMVTMMGGVADKSGHYWMLYTDDPAYEGGWGQCSYEGKTYVSASVGAESLYVRADCTYIWYLQEV